MMSDKQVMKSMIPALRQHGAEPVIPRDDSFAEVTRRRDFRFLSLRISRNANAGTARLSSQADGEWASAQLLRPGGNQ